MILSAASIVQTAWVVEDIVATEAFLSDHFGVGAWTSIPDVAFGPESCTYRGAPADFVAHVSLSYLGDMQLELIQPVRGESIYTEFLAGGGRGLHHICFEPEDYEAALRNAAAEGVDIVQQGRMMGGLMEFSYLDGAGAGVPYIELMRLSDDMRRMFDDVRARSQTR